MPKKTQRTRQSTIQTDQVVTNVVSGTLAVQATQSEILATDAVFEDMQIFKTIGEMSGDNPQKHGNLFECIEARKFNADAVRKGSRLSAKVTALKDPHAPADIQIVEGKELKANVQAKCTKSPAQAAHEFRHDKYRGMKRLAPIDKEPHIRRVVENRATHMNPRGDRPLNCEQYTDVGKNLEGRLSYGKVASEGTTYEETIFARDHPKLYEAKVKGIQAGREALTTGIQAAGWASLVQGGVSLAKNAYLYTAGEISGDTMTKTVVVDAGKAGVRKGTTTAVGTGLRAGAKEVGLHTLAKSNVATAVATGIVDCGVSVWKFAEGKITADEAMEQIGQTGMSTVSSIYVGAAAGAVFGPLGAALGSVAGYLVASQLYQGCLTVLKNARLAEEEAARIEIICAESIRQMRAQRAEFEACMEENIQIRRHEFSRCFKAIDGALENNTHEGAISAVADFLGLFGEKLKFSSFEDFDGFMVDSSETLQL